MGLLDDAIREHLELKRRRGSDPAEITRQEQEALGPARREPKPEPDAADERTDDDLPEPGGSEPVAPQARSEPPAPAPAAEDEDFFVDDPDDPFLPEEPPAAMPPAARAPAPPPVQDDPWDDETAAIVDAPAPDPTPRRSAAQRLAELDEAEARRAAPAPPPPPVEEDPFAGAGQPTREFTTDDVHDASGGGYHEADDIVPADEEHDGEDLLEETPEFLEETPEHDRLWFEQRPPRDFDFDG